MPIFVAPIAGILSDRIGARPLMATGLALQAFAIVWLAAVVRGRRRVHDAAAGVRRRRRRAWRSSSRRRPTRCSARCRPSEVGQASGATNTIRELGGVLGVAVLATVFSSAGGYASPQDYVDGMTAALPVGAAVLAVGALVALLVPGIERPARPRRRRRAPRRGARRRVS